MHTSLSSGIAETGGGIGRSTITNNNPKNYNYVITTGLYILEHSGTPWKTIVHQTNNNISDDNRKRTWCATLAAQKQKRRADGQMNVRTDASFNIYHHNSRFR